MFRPGTFIPGIDRRSADIQHLSASARPGAARPFVEARKGLQCTDFPYAVSIALLASGSVAAMMVEQAKPAPTYESALSRSWEDVHNRILAMAKDTVFPDSKLAWKPHPDARSVMEELRHVTIGLEMTTAEAKGEKFDFEAREKADAGKPKTRASVVAEMEAAIAALVSSRQIEAAAAAAWLARTPGRTLRQTGDRVPRQRRGPACQPAEEIIGFQAAARS